MEPLFNRVFARDIFEHFAKKCFTLKDLTVLAKCNVFLRDRFNNLSITFWQKEILRDFKAEITVRWLDTVNEDPKIGRICYLAHRFLNTHKELLEKNEVIRFDGLPSPVLCYQFSKLSYVFGGKEASLYNVIPLEDRKKFSSFVNYPRLSDYAEWNDHEALESYPFASISQEQLDNALLDAVKSDNINLKTIRMLLQAGAKNTRTNYVLSIVTEYCAPETINKVVLLLLDHAFDDFNLTMDVLENVGDRDDLPLNEEYIARLIELSSPSVVNSFFVTRLLNSCCYETFVSLKKIGAYLPWLNEKGNTLVYSNRIDFRLIRAILEEGEKPDEHSLTTLVGHCETDEEICTLLNLFKEFGADFKSMSTVLTTIYHKQFTHQSIKTLFKHGYPINQKDRFGSTCLHYVIQDYRVGTGRPKMVKILLEAGQKISDIEHPYLRYVIACSIGDLETLQNWEGDLKATDSIKTNPLLEAVNNQQLEVIEFLIKTKSITQLQSHKGSILRAASELQDSPIRKKIIILLIELFKEISVPDLIKMHYTDLLKDFFLKMPEQVKSDYLFLGYDSYIKCALEEAANGFLEVFEDVVDFYSEECWATQAPLIACVNSKYPLKIISRLYELHPTWLFHKNWQQLSLIAAVCKCLAYDNNAISEYMTLFRLVNKWIKDQPSHLQDSLYTGALRSLFDSSSPGNYSLFELPKEDRQEIYDTLFTSYQLKYDVEGESALHEIFKTLAKTLPPMEIWLEIKERLEKLDPDFSVKNRDDKTPIQMLIFFPGDVLNKLEQGINSSEMGDVFVDMIRFATERKGRRSIQGRKTSPLHSLAQLDLSSDFSVQLLKTFIELGYPIDIQNERGDTPLHVAIINGNNPAAMCLLEHNARVDITSNHDLTALSEAKKMGNLPLLAMMSPYAEIVRKKN